MVSEHTISKVTQSVGFDFDGVNAVLDQIKCELGDFRRALEKRGLKDFRRELFVEARYEGQVWELDTPLPCDRFRQESDVNELVEAFHIVHERVFAVRDEGSNLECVNWKGRITARLNSESEQADFVTERPAGEPFQSRQVYFGDKDAISTPIFRGRDLARGATGVRACHHRRADHNDRCVSRDVGDNKRSRQLPSEPLKALNPRSRTHDFTVRSLQVPMPHTRLAHYPANSARHCLVARKSTARSSSSADPVRTTP